MNTISCSASVWSLCLLLSAGDAFAQTAEQTIKSAMRTPELSPIQLLAQQHTDDFTVNDAAGRAGAKVFLNIASSGNASEEDLFEITGVPPEAALTAGERYNDFWLLRRKDLPSLAIVTPDGFAQKFNLVITRTGAANRSPLTRSVTITVSAGPASSGAIAASQAAPVMPLAYKRSEGEKVLFEKAYEKFKQGDVSGARAIFEYMAAKGDAEAASAMGETFDPIILQQLYVKGLTPDAAAAATWYRKAQQLGDAKARARLNALNEH